METREETWTGPAPEAEGLRPLIDEARRLAGDARTLAEAEIAYQAARAKVAATSVGVIAGWGAAAAALIFFAVMALVVGALLALATIMGPVLATLLVVVILLAAALLCGLLLRARVRRMMSLVFSADESE